MRTIILILLASSFVACNSNDHADHEGYVINGTLIGAPKNARIFLDKVIDNQVTVIDTARTDDDGKFVMLGYVKDRAIYSIRYSVNKTILVVLEPGKQQIQLNAGYPTAGNYTVTGHGLSTNITNYLNTVNGYYSSITKLQQQINQAYRGGAQQAQVNQIQQQYGSKINEMTRFVVKYIDTVQSGLLAGFASNMLDPNQQLDQMQKALKKLEAEDPESPYTKNLANKLRGIASTVVGAEAPDINLPDPNGQAIALSELRGNIVLIDFWASWCGPCRKENPNLVNLYHKYKEQGFKIYSVSLDNQKARWVQAIQRDQLEWTEHVSELVQRRWGDKVMQMYNFNSIPTSYLLDKEGNIIGKNLRGIQLQQKLAEVFES